MNTNDSNIKKTQIKRRPFGMRLSVAAICLTLLMPLFPAVQSLAADKGEKTIHVTEVIDEAELEDASHPHFTVHTPSGSKRLSDEYQDYTYEMCEKYGIKQYYNVILTQMYCESSYNQNAVSRSSSYGLMQIHSSNFSRLKSSLGLTNLKDPLQNIEAGVYMMADYVEKYGDIQTALVCYHRGEGAARKGMRSDSYSSRIVTLSSGLVAN